MSRSIMPSQHGYQKMTASSEAIPLTEKRRKELLEKVMAHLQKQDHKKPDAECDRQIVSEKAQALKTCEDALREYDRPGAKTTQANRLLQLRLTLCNDSSIAKPDGFFKKTSDTVQIVREVVDFLEAHFSAQNASSRPSSSESLLKGK